MSQPVTLKALSRTQGNNARIKDHRIEPAGFHLAFEEVEPLPAGFRRMVRNLEFDVAEMALTTYLCAHEHGVEFTALPIFLVRDFHHGAILHNNTLGIRHPKELEGQKVGVNRGYTVTTGVWARAILQDYYGVDLSKITWVLTGDEHVQSWQAPGNVIPLPAGQDMAQELIAGNIPAAIGVAVKDDRVSPLIANPLEAGLQCLQQDGHYPINHLVVVRNDILAQHPELAPALFHAFAESKQQYVADLKAGKVEPLTAIDRMHLRVMETMADPLPYGIEANRKTLETLIAHATAQGILQKSVRVEDVFAQNTLHLSA